MKEIKFDNEKEHIAFWEGFEYAVKLMQVPDCPFCKGKMKAGYACGEAFITPVGYRDGEGCEKCRNVPMHGNLRQVLEEWKQIRGVYDSKNRYGNAEKL